MTNTLQIQNSQADTKNDLIIAQKPQKDVTLIISRPGKSKKWYYNTKAKKPLKNIGKKDQKIKNEHASCRASSKSSQSQNSNSRVTQSKNTQFKVQKSNKSDIKRNRIKKEEEIDEQEEEEEQYDEQDQTQDEETMKYELYNYGLKWSDQLSFKSPIQGNQGMFLDENLKSEIPSDVWEKVLILLKEGRQARPKGDVGIKRLKYEKHLFEIKLLGHSGDKGVLGKTHFIDGKKVIVFSMYGRYHFGVGRNNAIKKTLKNQIIYELRLKEIQQ